MLVSDGIHAQLLLKGHIGQDHNLEVLDPLLSQGTLNHRDGHVSVELRKAITGGVGPGLAKISRLEVKLGGQINQLGGVVVQEGN